MMNAMPIFPDLSRRHLQPELMDQPGLDRAAHDGALAALARINALSGSARILWRELRQQGSAPLRVLDVATGGGDVPIRLWHKARRAGLKLTIAGCDRSPIAIEHAQRRAKEQQAAVEFFPLDALADPLPAGYDVLTSSLFLHHLEAADAVELLRRMAQAARVVLINDLTRSRLGYALAWLGTRLISRSQVTHIDGPLSVEGAFTPAEALAIAHQAGLAGAKVARRWPSRYLLKWERT